MSLADDLRKQAEHLARIDRRRPKQANLRRAISAAYYSLFHQLVEDATAMMFGRQPAGRRLRQVLARTYTHDSMVQACKSFRQGVLDRDRIAPITGPLPVAPALQDIAQTFVILQEERHRADYNLAQTFKRREVLALLQDLEAAIQAWKAVRQDDTARLFLMLLPLWRQLRR